MFCVSLRTIRATSAKTRALFERRVVVGHTRRHAARRTMIGVGARMSARAPFGIASAPGLKFGLSWLSALVRVRIGGVSVLRLNGCWRRCDSTAYECGAPPTHGDAYDERTSRGRAPHLRERGVARGGRHDGRQQRTPVVAQSRGQREMRFPRRRRHAQKGTSHPQNTSTGVGLNPERRVAEKLALPTV